MIESHYQKLRLRMVEEQLQGRDIVDPRVLAAMREVPRHLFIPETSRAWAYEDHPLSISIGYGQTISQHYIVALMLQSLKLIGDEHVLEVGTGSGYQAALLGKLASHVYTVEIIPELARLAHRVLEQLACDNVEVVAANGSIGWRTGAPYDAIIVSAASPFVPSSLREQLKEGGRLVLPVGSLYEQHLLRVWKRRDTPETEDLGECAFVPLVGEEGWKAGMYSH
jgi:protein-L-isoaspartate(D-aspartate) O-methyltransferase